jgi:hypothetical protein
MKNISSFISYSPLTGCYKKRYKDRPTAPPSVVFIVLIAQVRPHVLVTGSIQDIFIMRPQIPEGVVPRDLPVPPLIVAAPGAVPVADIPAAVPRRVFLASHPFSHPTTSLLKLKIQSFLGNKKISTRGESGSRQEGLPGQYHGFWHPMPEREDHKPGNEVLPGHIRCITRRAAINIPARQRVISEKRFLFPD